MSDMRRRGTRAAVAVALVVVVLAGTAYACTNYRGKMKVTGDVGTGTVEAVGLSQSGGMNFCSDPRNTGPAELDGVPQGGSGSPVGTITIEVTVGTCNSTTTQLDAGTYTVSWTSNFARDCMAQVGGTPEAVLGTFEVDTSGNGGPTDYTLPAVATSALDTAGVCLTSTTQAGALQGNKAPINVI